MEEGEEEEEDPGLSAKPWLGRGGKGGVGLFCNANVGGREGGPPPLAYVHGRQYNKKGRKFKGVYSRAP